MPNIHHSAGAQLVATMLGDRAASVLATIELDEALLDAAPCGGVSRVAFAAALNAVLFANLLDRVPTGAAFVADQRVRGERILLDHGAIRTVRFPVGNNGALPGGQDAFARILTPLGYHVAGVYPLPRLRMKGMAWMHRDMPTTLPQFFVSELHVEQFDAEFGMAARRVFGKSCDPLNGAALVALAGFDSDREVPFDAAAAALPAIVAAFDRQHPAPSILDYELLLERSNEAAWIATEGNAFNHATSRVPDVAIEARRQREAGRSIKDRVEISASRRIQQTAFRADPVVRLFRDGDNIIERTVPGSFYEIIARDIDPATGTLDLGFDSGNATGIFAMTQAA